MLNKTTFEPAAGVQLGRIVATNGLHRNPEETDAELRARCIASIKERANKSAEKCDKERIKDCQSR